MISLPHPISGIAMQLHASPALPERISPFVDIRSRQWVPALTVRLPRVNSRDANAAQDIHAVRYNLQVGDIDASPVAAEMIDREALRNRATTQFPLDPMNASSAPVIPDTTVTIAMDCSSPLDAVTGADGAASDPLLYRRTQVDACRHDGTPQ